MRLVALDLDDTLAGSNRRASDEALALLARMSADGCTLMLISGKPAGYLAGFARQMGVGSPVIAGENGAVIMASPDFPPLWERTVTVAPESRAWLERVGDEVTRDLGDDAWLQPNRVNLTVFWRSVEAREKVIATVAANMDDHGTANGFRSFVHSDCSEIVAPGADKGAALAYVLDRSGIASADAVAIGDSANDLPMFEVAGLSIGIGTSEGDRRFDDIEAALRWLLEEAR
jgi:HAD superfamily hydrolase (TIGR01484 family)